jgi:beta-phosphoglucomutase-like phosphatase (HAD superfamily)
MKIKAFFIDFDGVLVDSTKAYVKATTIALENIRNRNIHKEKIRDISLEIARRLDLGFSREKLLDGVVSIAPNMNTKFLDIWLKTWNEACLWEVDPILGVHEILTHLSKQYPLALVTLRHIKKSLIKDQLERLELNKFFKVIITALDVKKPKPNPESFFEGSRKLNVKIQDCAIVGDSITDIRAGKASGTKTIAVLSGIFNENALRKEKPDLIINNITEILSYLKQ